MTSIENKVLNDKYLGSLTGALVGDALGWPQEDRSMKIGKRILRPQKSFQKWERKSGGRFYQHIDEIKEGEYSDDGQLLIATARSLQKNENWYSHFVRLELPAWLLYERGGGGATKKACRLWSSGTPPWKSTKQLEINQYFEAGGNGVAMRILPHVFLSLHNTEELIQQVFKNGIATHGHPRAILGAIFYAYALKYLVLKENTLGYGELIDYLIENKNEWSTFPNIIKIEDWFAAANKNANGDYLSLWSLTANEILEDLLMLKDRLALGILDSSNETLDLLKCFDKRFRGAGTTTSLVSIYIASKYASEPTTGLLEVSFLKNADSDTIASMVGGLFGAIHGTEWLINEWYKVQDYDYIKNLVTSSMRNKEEEAKKIVLWSVSNKKQFLNNIETLDIGESINFGPFEE
ncbi:ADP-ribosylglycohydrolase family protein, partial [Priestia megaterium]|uniref:ADP-ribosylglycohydrolase family protein n=1 Tax=Priestia megaterium TaxID=1404 RepID=UPI002FFF338D